MLLPTLYFAYHLFTISCPENAGQTKGSTSRQDLASAMARKQHQITAAHLAPAGL